jgi:hypothetical protein
MRRGVGREREGHERRGASSSAVAGQGSTVRDWSDLMPQAS